ncbi:MAG TPA: tRNA (adenosine(37)-N6)-threonylcarbamoyltransferase complex ATPase subunit type 1 TsaE [Gemmatimonadales bacterium]|jgi:tRNA threonylcarbamoyladenosine biosynthesis protein TsaE
MKPTPLGVGQVEELGRAWGRDLAPGSVVWLEGPLGAGKTTLARAMVQARGITDGATSPTYALVHHYQGSSGAVYHVDCYRLRTPDDAADLDWETLAAGELLIIEWPERAGAWAPRPTVRIRLAHAEAETRLVEVA